MDIDNCNPEIIESSLAFGSDFKSCLNMSPMSSVSQTSPSTIGNNDFISDGR